jgi:hypothetical protein
MARYRILSIVSGVALIGLLLTAGMLKPDARGLGTHQQLGLAPCTFRLVFAIRCPACGMTTSWAYLTHGQPLAALKANVGGTLLGILAIGFGPWLLVSGIRGRWLWKPAGEWTLVVGCIVLMLVIVLDWVCRLLVS